MAKTAPQKPTAEGVLEELRSRLEELRDQALAEIREAVAQAEQRESQYHHRRGELDQAREHLTNLEEEHARLPMESHTARMRGQTDREQQLNERFQELESLIPADEERARALAAECDEFLHGSARALPSAGATITAYGPALRTATPHKESFDTLQEQVEELLTEVRKPVDKEHGDLLALIRTQGSKVERAYRESGYTSAQDVPSH